MRPPKRSSIYCVFITQPPGFVCNSVLCAPVCPEPPSVTAIIGAAIGSVALIGILLLMLIKFFIYVKDVKEFRKFEKEKKKSKWTDVSLSCQDFEIRICNFRAP